MAPNQTTITATTRGPLPTLPTLSQDVTETIASFLPPSSLLALSSTCRNLRSLSLSPEIWTRLTRRHFPSRSRSPSPSLSPSPSSPSLSPSPSSTSPPSLSSFLALSASASSRWRVTMGAIVADTPTHVRGGRAVAARAHGGADRVLSTDLCAEMDQRGFYVVQIGGHGGPAAAGGLSAAAGSPRGGSGGEAVAAEPLGAGMGWGGGGGGGGGGEVELDWRWKGAFPRDGVVVRVVCGLVGTVEETGGVDVAVNGVVVGAGVRVVAADGRRTVVGEVGVVEVRVRAALLRVIGDNVNVVSVKWGAGGAVSGTWWVSEVEVLPVVTSDRKRFDQYEAVGQSLPIAVPIGRGRRDVDSWRRGPRVWEKKAPVPGSPTSVFGF